ncbi:hypothetical protein FRC12_004427 [Ceratobasidium sp. 428]|nr:hypothetical protein FRC12_004427 [Ceratobasidium sp. 428]
MFKYEFIGVLSPLPTAYIQPIYYGDEFGVNAVQWLLEIDVAHRLHTGVDVKKSACLYGAIISGYGSDAVWVFVV